MEILPEPDILLDPTPTPEIPLPKGWTALTLQTVLHVITLARIIVLNVANWPADKECDGLRLRVENDRLRGEIELLKREIAVKDSRFNRIPAKKRPAYVSTERFEILAIKAARGWSNEKVADCFQVRPGTSGTGIPESTNAPIRRSAPRNVSVHGILPRFGKRRRGEGV